MSETRELLNRGFFANPPDDGSGAVADPSGRTIIVTGLKRSGTSLVAAMLRRAGIFMGNEINDAVNEDEEIAVAVASRNVRPLMRAIRDRDANYRTWGFKLPMIALDITASHLALFNNPRVIIPFRDPVAISVRNALADFREPLHAMRGWASDTSALMAFIDRLAYPSLMLSYEKLLVSPDDIVDALMRFCGIPTNDALCRRLIDLIEPNRQDYIQTARRRHEGKIEGVLEGHLRGWCQLTKSSDPVSLDIFVDGVLVQTVVADIFRRDLLDAGKGKGHHGFSIKLDELGLRNDAIIRVKVSHYGTELGNSNHPLSAYPEVSD